MICSVFCLFLKTIFLGRQFDGNHTLINFVSMDEVLLNLYRLQCNTKNLTKPMKLILF